MKLVSSMTFQSVDQIAARFKIDKPGPMRSNVAMTFARDVLPADYEAAQYNIEANIVIEIKAIPIKKK